MSARLRSCLASAVVLIALSAGPAWAGGFAAFDAGARGMGFAGAFTAQASDPSAMFHNPAGIAFLKGTRLYLGGALEAPSSSFTGADPFPGAGRTEKLNAGILPIPAAYLTHQWSESLVLGVGVMTPFARRTAWNDPDHFSGRFLSERAVFRAYSVTPTVAFKIRDRLAVGLGVDLRLSQVTLERRIPTVDPYSLQVVDAATWTVDGGTRLDYGFSFGLLARPNDRLSLGLSYRHRINAKFAGTSQFTPIPTGHADLDAGIAESLPGASLATAFQVEFPAVLSTGVAYELRRWTVEVDANWYQWTSYDRLILRPEGRPDLDQVINEQYQDVVQFRAGIERRLGRSLSIRGGYVYDPSPAPTASVSPMFPDADRHGVALGASWDEGRWRLDGAFRLGFSPARSTEGMSRDHYDGSYSNSETAFGVSLGYRF